MHMQFVTILVMCILAGAEVDLLIPSFPELQRVFGLLFKSKAALAYLLAISFF